MRCWDIWRCWGAKSFYSKLIRLWYQSKSAQAVLEKLNENPEWSAQKLAEEWHLICNVWDESDINLRSASSGGTFSSDCFLARHSGEFGSTNVCYDFWDWKKAFILTPMKTKSDVAEPEWISVDCWANATIEDLHVLCDRYWIDYVLYQLNEGEIELSRDYVGDNWYIEVDWKKECFCGYYLYARCLRENTRAKPTGPCWRKRKCSLLTYEELKEIYRTTPVLEELNSYPQEYFQSLTAHLTQGDFFPNLRTLEQSCTYFPNEIRFNTETNLRESWSCGK